MHAAWVKDEPGTRSLQLLATFDPVSALFTLNPSLLDRLQIPAISKGIHTRG